jgi:hypothetical protein
MRARWTTLPCSSEVADLTDGSSPQPGRVSVRGHIADLLATAPTEKSGLARGYTHRELACSAYSTDEPTAAQESAVRRAVAALVAAGLAERDTADRRATGWDHKTGRHLRRSRYGETTYEYANPAGILVRRVMTEADRERRAAVVEAWGMTDYAERIRRGDAS